MSRVGFEHCKGRSVRPNQQGALLYSAVTPQTPQDHVQTPQDHESLTCGFTKNAGFAGFAGFLSTPIRREVFLGGLGGCRRVNAGWDRPQNWPANPANPARSQPGPRRLMFEVKGDR